MIKDPKFYEEWERKELASEPPDYERNLKMFEALVEHARVMGVWPPDDPVEDLGAIIRVAKVMNGIKPD